MATFNEFTYSVDNDYEIHSKVLKLLDGMVTNYSNDSDSDIRFMFNSNVKPTITVSDYIQRIFKYSECSSESAILAFIYINSFLQLSNSKLNIFNAHRILLVGFMLANKFLDDEVLDNAHYARIGCVSLSEINMLEIQFLCSINYSLHISNDIFQRYYENIHSLMVIA